jgi:hypothetical protein
MLRAFGFAAVAIGGTAVASLTGGFDTEPAGWSVTDRGDHVAYRWSGGVDDTMTAALDATYGRHKTDLRRIVISLNSGGGRIGAGLDVIDRIKRMKDLHIVDTVVDEGSVCASMCVPIFLTGRTRWASPKARFMFHEPSMPRQELQKLHHQNREMLRSGRISEKEFKSVLTSLMTDRFFADFFERAGLDDKWIGKLRANIKGRDLWFTASELRAQRTGVIDQFQ